MDTLLIIDPQNDFVLSGGALPVAGAVEDMDRLIKYINDATNLGKIIITLDSHTPGHIATAAYWMDSDGVPPPPFTVITYADALAGRWEANGDNNVAVKYLKELEAKGKRHTIWPEHCVDGTFGWKPYAPLAEAVESWLYRTGGAVNVHKKGAEPSTEMFSAVMPEVSLSKNDAKNAEFFLSLFNDSDTVFVAGEAENFCVKETVSDMVSMRPNFGPKIRILRESMSSIPVGDDIEAFWRSMKEKGVTVALEK